jgi:ppGpp synthetase/RelA/SpoT-type nucleotidyltranferase
LKAGDRPSVDDLALLQSLLEAYDEALEVAAKKVWDGLNVRVSSRIKNTGTITEKLRRSDRASLDTIQDLAGIRIVMDGSDRRAQDSLVARLSDLFEEATRPVRQVDRRADPRSGYRAVHLIVHVDDVPVEIQVRTELQHEWAEFFEKLADRLGRGIRYGEQASFGNLNLQVATDLPEHLQRFADDAVGLALLCADLISAIEEEGAQGVIGNEKRERYRAEVQKIMSFYLKRLMRLRRRSLYWVRCPSELFPVGVRPRGGQAS